ncbi:MAG: hypothetical protein PHG03_01500 [Bacilli bacterium]|nr:hypothetical protein [Bacilli bacterium]MDD4795219.1 hypothetical protein [Bacilli bacterium]
MKKGPLTLSVIHIFFLSLAIIFKDKYIYLAPSLSVSISLFIYSFTFLFPVLIINWSKLKDAKNLIKISTKAMFIFILIITILSSISGNIDTEHIDSALKLIFTPNSINIKNIIIHYPNLNIIGIIITYYFSHTILISIYEALKEYTNKYLSYCLSIFIAFIIDTMFMVPLMHITDIYYANVVMLDIIKYLTAAFMVVIFTSLIIILIFTFYTHFKEKN